MLGPLVSSRRIAEAGNQNPRKRRHGAGRLAVGCHPMRVDPYTKGPPSTSSAVIARSESARFWADWDGTVMEQRGRNRWQTFGSPKSRKWLDLGPNRCHGKEGVDGS